MNTPYGTEAQVGFLAGQSKQTLFSGLERIFRKRLSLSNFASLAGSEGTLKVGGATCLAEAIRPKSAFERKEEKK